MSIHFISNGFLVSSKFFLLIEQFNINENFLNQLILFNLVHFLYNKSCKFLWSLIFLKPIEYFLKFIIKSQSFILTLVILFFFYCKYLVRRNLYFALVRDLTLNCLINLNFNLSYRFFINYLTLWVSNFQAVIILVK